MKTNLRACNTKAGIIQRRSLSKQLNELVSDGLSLSKASKQLGIEYKQAKRLLTFDL